MKYWFILLSFLPMLASAQPPAMQQELLHKLQQMDPQQMQQHVQKMQKCLNGQEENLKQLQIRGQRIGEKIEAFCDAGKRGEAERLAREEGEKFMNDPVVQRIQKCGVPLANKLKLKFGAKGDDARHPCDYK